MAKEPSLTDAEIRQRLTALPGWRYDNGMIRRTYKTDG